MHADTQCQGSNYSDDDILKIYPKLICWEEVAKHLGLKEPDVEAV